MVEIKLNKRYKYAGDIFQKLIDIGFDIETATDFLNNIKDADVVEVVRCKDCIHRDPEDKKCDCSFQAKGGIFPMDDNDFRSYGERRTDDDL